MRSAIISAGIAVAILVSAGCTITTRSDNYACTGDGECEPGRVCVSGWCVAPICPDECDSCLDGNSVCVIDCVEAGECGGVVTCPDNMSCTILCENGNCAGGVDCGRASTCEVTCSGSNSCTGGVDCSDADACDITCSGPDSCNGEVACGTGTCNVDCSGSASCVTGVDCVDSCACVTSCAADACTGAHLCPRDGMCLSGNVCQDMANCNRC